MKTPAELAAILRERLIHSRPHYDINGRPLRTIVVTQEWLEDMADAANALDAAPAAQPVAQVMSWGDRIDCGVVQWLAHTGQPLNIGQLLYAAPVAPVARPSLDKLTQKFSELPEVSGKVVSVTKI